MTLPSASTLGGTYWQPQMSAHWSILNECAVMHASYRLYGDEHACASVHGEQPSVVPVEVVRRSRKQSEAVGSSQKQSEAVRRNQKQSEAVRGSQKEFEAAFGGACARERRPSRRGRRNRVPEILWQSEACCLQSQIMPHLRLSFTSPLRQSA